MSPGGKQSRFRARLKARARVGKRVARRIGTGSLVQACYSGSPLGVLLKFSAPSAIALYYLAGGSSPTLEAGAWFTLGIFYWTLLEYLLHRFVFHFEFKSEFWKRWHYFIHMNHHDAPNDYSILNGGPAFLLPAAGLVAFLPFYLITGGDLFITSWILMGSVLGHWFYEWVHYMSHASTAKSGLLGYLRKYHMDHHFVRQNAQFGVTSPLWDKVFRT